MTFQQVFADPITLTFIVTLAMAALGIPMAYEAGRLQGHRDERRRWLSFRCEWCLSKDTRRFISECESTPLPFWVRWLARIRDR